MKQPSRKPSRGRCPCHVCSTEGHLAFKCPEHADLKDKRSVNKKSVTFKSEKSSKEQKTEIDGNRFSRRERGWRRRGVR